MKKVFTLILALTALFLVACEKSCQQCNRTTTSWKGADFMVVQFDQDGKPFNCWKLQDVAIVDDDHSGGIWWTDDRSGDLVHISGWYNYIQIGGGMTGETSVDAAKALGIDLFRCGHGRYLNIDNDLAPLQNPGPLKNP